MKGEKQWRRARPRMNCILEDHDTTIYQEGQNQLRTECDDEEPPPPPPETPFIGPPPPPPLKENQPAIEDAKSNLQNDVSELEKCLIAARTEALRLQAAIEPPANTGRGYGISTSSDALEFGLDDRGQDEQLFHYRLSVLTQTMNAELTNLKPYRTHLWLGTPAHRARQD